MPAREACNVPLTRSLELICVTPSLLFATNALINHNKQVLTTVLDFTRGNLFDSYAKIFAAVGDVPPPYHESFTLVFSSLVMVMTQTAMTITGKDVDKNRILALNEAPIGPFCSTLYRGWINAMASSHVLEHSCKAFIRLESFAKASLAAGNCNQAKLCQRLVDMTVRLGTLVECTVTPHLKQPIFSLCPRPLAMLFSADPVLVGTLDIVRTILSGTCVQFWLGKELIEAWQAARGGEGKTFGLPTAALLPMPLKLGLAPHFQYLMNLCSTVWQVTVSGPQPPLMQATLARQQPLVIMADLSLPASMPYSAVDVYDMGHESIWSIVKLLPVFARTRNADLKSIGNTVWLLARLILELEPRHAVPRLPSLWRVLSHLTPVMSVGDLIVTTSYNRIIITLLQMRLASDVKLGPGRGEDGQQSCSASLHSALSSGLMGSLEQTLRRLGRLCSANVSAIPESLDVGYIVLSASGVWPAVLAHGSEKDIASLIVTLGKVAHARLACGNHIISIAKTMGVPTMSTVYLVALMEQAVAIILQPWNLVTYGGNTAASDSSTSKTGEACDSKRSFARSISGGQSEGQGAAGSGEGSSDTALAAAKRRLLALGNSLEGHFGNALDVDWLAEVGGQPPPGSPAAEQQRRLAVFAIMHWLPRIMSISPLSHWLSVSMSHAMSRLVLLVALQYMEACFKVETSQSQLTHRSYASWRALLISRMGVANWLKGVLNSLEQMQYHDPELVQGALDVLEILLITTPFDIISDISIISSSSSGMSNPDDKAVKSEDEDEGCGGGSSSMSIQASSSTMPTSGDTPCRLEEAVLLRCGRKNLLAVVHNLISKLPLLHNIANVSITMKAVQKLREEVFTKHHIAQFPSLPTPEEVERAAAAVGVQVCANPFCSTLRGAHESDLEYKRCSRCQAVNYCSTECQRADWSAGHRLNCKRATQVYLRDHDKKASDEVDGKTSWGET
ncbi:hypothetical protein VaNZ11_011631 [Volvox africanus]|uniref:phytol kinase n=1 Tax=Volvox africanus TaxID=51714 RepID=A0ABQ5SD85_9CHLO|nr:hypothetical protein VaNZ11_011631 [Volvox africanus]